MVCNLTQFLNLNDPTHGVHFLTLNYKKKTKKKKKIIQALLEILGIVANFSWQEGDSKLNRNTNF